jgi:hypothetical protein
VKDQRSKWEQRKLATHAQKTEKVTASVAGHLDVHIDHKDCRYGDAWLEVLAGHSELIGSLSGYGIHGISGEGARSEGIKPAAKGWLCTLCYCRRRL